MLGTEQGALLSVNMRKRAAASTSSTGGGKPGAAASSTSAAGAGSGGGAPAAPATGVVDPSVITPLDLSAAGRHHGPVTAVQRNPFYPSGVLSVGDWGFRLWHDKNKSPILTSPYCAAFLTAGCWSYCRPGVLFTTRTDGVLDVWDLLTEQARPACSHRVSPHALASLAAQLVPSASGAGAPVGGRLLAVGDAQGTVSLLQASAGLVAPLPDEKGAMGALLERESRREEALEKRAAASARAARTSSSSSSSSSSLSSATPSSSASSSFAPVAASSSQTPGGAAPTSTSSAGAGAGAPPTRASTLGGCATPGGVGAGGSVGAFATGGGAAGVLLVGDEGRSSGGGGGGRGAGGEYAEQSEAEARAVWDAEAAFFAAVGMPQGRSRA